MSWSLLGAQACDSGVDSGSSAAAALPEIAVSEHPTMTLADDGSEERLFSRIEVRRTMRGEIVVADVGAATIRVFGRDGAVRRTLARRGHGPGELSGAFAVMSHADTLYALGRPPEAPPDISAFDVTTGFVGRRAPLTVDAEQSRW